MLNYLSSVTLRLSTSGNQLELSAYLFLLSSNQLCHSEFITPKSDCVAWGFKGLSLDWHEFQGYSVIFLGLRKEKSGICRSMRSRSCLVNWLDRRWVLLTWLCKRIVTTFCKSLSGAVRFNLHVIPQVSPPMGYLWDLRSRNAPLEFEHKLWTMNGPLPYCFVLTTWFGSVMVSRSWCYHVPIILISVCMSVIDLKLTPGVILLLKAMFTYKAK